MKLTPLRRSENTPIYLSFNQERAEDTPIYLSFSHNPTYEEIKANRGNETRLPPGQLSERKKIENPSEPSED